MQLRASLHACLLGRLLNCTEQIGLCFHGERLNESQQETVEASLFNLGHCYRKLLRLNEVEAHPTPDVMTGAVKR